MSALHERVRWGPFLFNLGQGGGGGGGGGGGPFFLKLTPPPPPPPRIDLHPISHYNISTESNIKVMRLEEMITT